MIAILKHNLEVSIELTLRLTQELNNAKRNIEDPNLTKLDFIESMPEAIGMLSTLANQMTAQRILMESIIKTLKNQAQ